MKRIILITIAFIVSFNITAQKLRFHKNGTFKILQFTDTHWDNKSDNCAKTIHTMQTVLKKEKPDFVVFTGDIVTEKPVKEGWIAVSKPVVEAKIPWTVAFGNHDEELDVSKKVIFDLLQTLPYFIGEKGEVSGVGNFTLPIYSSASSEKITTVMYIFDSHDYTHNPKLGNYDWIKFDQIRWYRSQSEQYAAQNNGKPIPSLSFFHIPLKEYNEVANSRDFIGNNYEGAVASSEINSGLFAAMLEMKDMIGVFVGHDHDNNYIGITRNIALGYGQVTGYDAYGRMERGGRVIELKEDNPSSFHTWITTPTAKMYDFYYPSGLPAITDSTNILKAHDVNPTKQGIKYRYYEYAGEIETVNQIDSMTIVKVMGILPNISIDSAKREDYFAFDYSGWIKIPATGYYKFYIYSDDGAVLYIDDKAIVDNDGGHSARRKEGVVALEKGFHKIRLKYFESYMGNVLEIGMSSIKISERIIPKDFIYAE